MSKLVKLCLWYNFSSVALSNLGPYLKASLLQMSVDITLANSFAYSALSLFFWVGCCSLLTPPSPITAFRKRQVWPRGTTMYVHVRNTEF